MDNDEKITDHLFERDTDLLELLCVLCGYHETDHDDDNYDPTPMFSGDPFAALDTYRNSEWDFDRFELGE